MTALMRMQDDAAALQVALNIVQRATDALGILPGTPFPARPSPSESPPDQGHMPAKAGPSPVSRCILPEIIHARGPTERVAGTARLESWDR